MPLRTRKEKLFPYPLRNIGDLDLRDGRRNVQVSNVVQPVIVLAAAPVVGAHFYKHRAQVVAVAAQTQAIAFFGAKLPTFLDRLEIFVSVAGAVRIVAGEPITPAAWTLASLGSDNDMNRQSPVAPQAFIGTNQNFATAGRIVRRHSGLAINTPWVVDNLQLQSFAHVTAASIAANALVVQAETINTTVDVNFEWREIL